MGKTPPWPAGVWHVIGRSVQGASHIRAGMPNQDAIQWFPASGVGPPLILSVSDGHGSPRNFRSDVGARFAVEEMTNLMRELLSTGQPDPTRLSTIKRIAEERIPGELTRRWRAAVTRHLQDNPITPQEWETLEKRRDLQARRAIEKEPSIAYGATLLSVLITAGYILYLQLGDGDILTVAETGEVMRPMTRDPRLIANETTSLCMDEAWREVQIKFQALYGPHPALIVLSSDGYANSFVNDAAFIKVGSDILDILRTDGLEVVEQSLETWLTDASKAGSGDDITLGLIFPAEILPSTRPTPAVGVEKPPRPAPRKRKSTPARTPEVIKQAEKEPAALDQAWPVQDQEPLQPQAPPAVAVASDATQSQQGEESRPLAVLPEGEKAAAGVQPSEALPVEPPPKPKIERIKEEESPREPSKKLPNIFYDD
ncbi:MAG TPA: protein phosphatase 2C domain-containing protein [Anaerolineae bacterium]|nr:protein phosphatase 2C domain-containing protein [Anaerolineae bacterium]HQH39874.1 protein phosphatase 2C domain-containing protein [Anaerolineae bacterium]